MNLNKRQLVSWGLPAAVILTAAVYLVLMRIGYLEQQTANRAVRSELQRLQQRSPYPSPENVKAVRKTVEQMEFRVGELAALMHRDPFPEAASGPADFSARVQRAIERLQQRAEVAGIILADSMEAGFANYASGGAVPEQPTVPRLSRQLESVERVLDALVRGGVTSIESVHRDEFEQAGPVSPVRRIARRAPRNEEPRLEASREHPSGAFYVERIEVTFTAHEAALWRVLNGVAAAPHCMATVGLTHRVQTDILNYNPEAVKRGDDSEDQTLRYLSEGILAGSQALTRPERIIVGNDPIRVGLTVDVYNFKPEEVAP